MSVAMNIKRFRMRAGLTQEQLAELVGYIRSTIAQWETGWTQPRMGAIRKLSEALDVSMSEIVAEEDGDERTRKLLDLFEGLNESGKDEALERLREMTELPRWSR